MVLLQAFQFFGYSGIFVSEPFGFGVSNYVLVLSETVLVIEIESVCRVNE